MIEPICAPCPEVKQFIPVALPDVICPCPEPEEPPPMYLPKVVRSRVETDCFQAMLLNMTTQFFCDDGPKAC